VGDEIGRRTRGALIIKVYSSAILAKERSVLEAVRIGLADAGEVVTVVAPGKTPLATVGQTPLGDSDLYVNHRAMQDLINHYSLSRRSLRNSIKSPFGLRPQEARGSSPKNR